MLAQSTLATDLRPDQLGVLAEHAEFRRYAAGAPILRREDTSFPLLAVLEGEAEVRGMFAQGVGQVKPGALIGEIAFLDRGPRTADVVATADSLIAVFPEDLLDRLSGDQAEIAARVGLNLARVLCSKLRWAQRLIDAGDAAAGGGPGA